MNPKVHEDFDVFKYLDFLRHEKIVAETYLAKAVTAKEYSDAVVFKSDVSNLAWVIDDLEHFATKGRHL